MNGYRGYLRGSSVIIVASWRLDCWRKRQLPLAWYIVHGRDMMMLLLVVGYWLLWRLDGDGARRNRVAKAQGRERFGGKSSRFGGKANILPAILDLGFRGRSLVTPSLNHEHAVTVPPYVLSKT